MKCYSDLTSSHWERLQQGTLISVAFSVVTSPLITTANAERNFSFANHFLKCQSGSLCLLWDKPQDFQYCAELISKFTDSRALQLYNSKVLDQLFSIKREMNEQNYHGRQEDTNIMQPDNL